MVTAQQLQSIITDLESDRVERTTSVRDRNKIRQAICAFANDFGGRGFPRYFLIGARDDGSLDGMRCNDDLLKDLAAVRAEGRIWIRVGPTRAIASPEDERRLIERASASTRTFDAQPAVDADPADLALDLFTLSYRSIAIADDVLAANDRPLEQQLAALGFLDRRSGCPTNAGVLLFGKEPRGVLPGAYVQLVKVHGHQLTDDIAADLEVSGDLASVIREAERFLDVHIPSHPIPSDGFRERASAAVPQFVLRELFLNAVMHRDYQSTEPIRVHLFSDRLEIQNPAGAVSSGAPFRHGGSAHPMTTLAIFNNKGGVGKTSITWYLSYALARLERHVLVVDADPQANLTATFYDDETVEAIWNGGDTVYGMVEPVIRGLGDARPVQPLTIEDHLTLLPGDMRLAAFEPLLSDSWPRGADGNEAALRQLTAAWRGITGVATAVQADLVLLDLGPNLGSLTRSYIVMADDIIVPAAPDLCSRFRGCGTWAPCCGTGDRNGRFAVNAPTQSESTHRKAA